VSAVYKTPIKPGTWVAQGKELPSGSGDWSPLSFTGRNAWHEKHWRSIRLP